MLSVLVYGRNDAYGASLQRRSALSINALADVLSDDDEIVFVDYNTDNHRLTFIEMIGDTLTARAKALVRIVRVRPEQHALLTHADAPPVVESVARNIGLRHTNPANRWVLSTNPDIIMLPPVHGLRALLQHLDDGYYCAPRFEVPRFLWQNLPRQDPAATREAIAHYAQRLHLDERVSHYLPAIGYDAPGDFQLALRSDLFEIGGFDEAMQKAWHVDANLMARLALKYGAPISLADRLRVYHCEHTADSVAKHSAGRSEDNFETFVTHVQSITANASDPWGGEGLDFETITLATSTGTWIAGALAEVIGSEQAEPYCAVYGPESFNVAPRPHAHILPFLIDRVFSLSRMTRMLWIGEDSDLRSLMQQALDRIGFSSPLLKPDDPGALAEADLVLLDNPALPIPDDQVMRFERQIDALVVAELARLERGSEPRQLIVVNAINCHLETALIDLFDVVLSPFTTRLRPALINPAKAGRGSWLRALSVGSAGQRRDGGEAIAFQAGTEGHVFYGPYQRLYAGDYQATVNIEPQTGEPGRLVLEVVRGDAFLAQMDCAVVNNSPISQSIAFTVTDTGYLSGGESVQIRLWSDGYSSGQVTAVEVERL